MEDRGVCRARFIGVLHGQHRPAVLIEAGFLSNPGDARQIETPAFRQKLAQAVADALRLEPEIENPKSEDGRRKSETRSQRRKPSFPKLARTNFRGRELVGLKLRAFRRLHRIAEGGTPNKSTQFQNLTPSRASNLRFQSNPPEKPPSFLLRGQHAMAGNQNRNRIRAARAADGADGPGLANCPRDFAVAFRFAQGDFPQSRQTPV